MSSFGAAHQTSPELLRISCSVSLFFLCANGAIEEAVISALLILASSFSRRPVADLFGTYVCADTALLVHKLGGIRFSEEMLN